MVIDVLTRGGKERRLIELLKSLTTHTRFRFELVILSNKIDYHEIFKLDVKVHCLERKIKKDPLIFLSLWKICKEFQPHIIQSWELMASVYSAPIARLMGIKFVNAAIRSEEHTSELQSH